MTSMQLRHQAAGPELLAPAGNMEKFQTALLYGANAVYLGGQSHNLRAGCEGFSDAELHQAVAEAHAQGVFVYYCMNSLPMQGDLSGVPAALEDAASAGVDAFIIADPGIFRMARTYAPQVPVHVSTQVNSTNSEALAFWQDLGATRVNLARELPAEDIAAIRAALPGMETEVFVHGAMCLAVSGQCLMSAWLNNRPANLGRCTHPCRFEYRALSFDAGHNHISCFGAGCGEGEPHAGTNSHGFTGSHGLVDSYSVTDPVLTVADKTRPDQPLWHVQQGGMDDAGERYSSIWAPQDLCLFPYLPWFMQQGVTALKIEGRMKGPGYVAHVVDAYSSALTLLRRLGLYAPQANQCKGHHGAKPLPRGLAPCMPEDALPLPDAVYPGFDWQRRMPELLHTASRPLGTGFFLSGQRRNLTQEMAEMASRSAGVSQSNCGPANFGHASCGPTDSGWAGPSGAAGSCLQSQPGIHPTEQAAQRTNAPHELLGKLLEQEGQSWKVAVRGTWHTAEPLEVMIPGLERPQIIPAAVENHRGERTGVVHPGTVVTLHLHPKDAEQLACAGSMGPHASCAGESGAKGHGPCGAKHEEYGANSQQPAHGLRAGLFLRSL